MDEPKPFDSLFKEKIFRIPDYQRGYAWQQEQLKDFWEDLVNLSGNRSHYTGVLTLTKIPLDDIQEDDKEFWLVDDHSYHVYHIVDGQQRLTTFVIFLQALVNLVKSLPTNKDRPDSEIYISDSLSIAELQSRYLFKVKPTGDKFRTYKFGYTEDNPSYSYLRFRVLGEEGGGTVEETFYTLNLGNAVEFFAKQLGAHFEQTGMEGLQDIFKKLTKRFLFNEYIIKDDFDVFVAFETMNNRGKKLSDLELLKNRLIYLTTIYDDELDAADRTCLRDDINAAWKEVYHQLGRNKLRPLNDDDFLRAHWTMYFKYSRQTGRDYIHFLLNEQFTPKKVRKKIAREVLLESPEEMRADVALEDTEEEEEDNGNGAEEPVVIYSAQLEPREIRDFVNSLKESAVHWFNSFYPGHSGNLSTNEQHWIDRLNRVGMGYFRPLVMAILKNEPTVSARIEIFKKIERFIFIAFRTTAARANYRSPEFYNASRAFDRGEITLNEIATRLDRNLAYTFHDDGTLRISEFYNILFKKFKAGDGYYDWPGLRYLLFEYEVSLLRESRQSKVEWGDFLKAERDRVSIEHIYPQTETDEWARAFERVEEESRKYYNGSIGNLLLLSMSINSSLQNDSFDDKKRPKIDPSGKKLRNGYSDGSHSEIEVSHEASWGPEQVRVRGQRLLRFMEQRWGFHFRNDEDRDSLLFLDAKRDVE